MSFRLLGKINLAVPVFQQFFMLDHNTMNSVIILLIVSKHIRIQEDR